MARFASRERHDDAHGEPDHQPHDFNPSDAPPTQTRLRLNTAREAVGVREGPGTRTGLHVLKPVSEADVPAAPARGQLGHLLHRWGTSAKNITCSPTLRDVPLNEEPANGAPGTSRSPEALHRGPKCTVCFRRGASAMPE